MRGKLFTKSFSFKLSFQKTSIRKSINIGFGDIICIFFHKNVSIVMNFFEDTQERGF